MADESCPTRDQLAALAAGDLPRPDLERLARHAEVCSRCAHTLAELDDPTDPLLAGLREPATGSDAPVPDRLRSALLGIATNGPVTGPREPVEYTVLDGDTLSTISQQFYGTTTRAREIYEANRARLKLKSMDSIRAGQVLVIPAIGG